MEYLSRGGCTPPQWNIYPHGGGGTPLQWNIYLEGEVHHLNGILIHRGGGTPPQWNIFPSLPFSPMPHFSTLFFYFGGGVPLCCMDSHSSQLSIFMMGFFLWVVVLGKGDRDPQQGAREATLVVARRGSNDGGQRDVREGGMTRERGQARCQRQRVEKMVDRGSRGKGARGIAAGWGVGNPALRECAPRLM